MRRTLLLFVLSIFISLVLGEALLRTFWHNPYRYEEPERVLRLPIHHARSNYIFNRSLVDPDQPWVRFQTDERSYILPSRRFATPDATVAFLGGSTTECFAVREELRFPARVSYLLEQKGLKVNTLNAARSGNTTHDSINVLVNHVVQDRPDFVVLMEAWNDIGLLSEYMSYMPRMGQRDSSTHAARFALQRLSSAFYVMALFRNFATFGRPQRGSSVPVTKPVPREEYEKRLRAFVVVSRAFGIEPVLMTQPAADFRNALTPDWGDLKNLEAFNGLMRKVAAEEKIFVIDLERHLIDAVRDWNQPGKIFYDGVHVNDRGSEVYAAYIAEQLFREVLIHPTRKVDNRESG